MLSKYTSLATFPTLDHKPSNDTWHVIKLHVIKVCATDSLTVGNGRSVWAFYIYQEIPEIPVGLPMHKIFRFVPLENFRKRWNFWKGTLVFPLEFSDWTACSIYGFRKGLPVPGRSRPYLRQGNMTATPSASSVASVSSAFFESSVCLSWPGSWFRKLGILPVACTSRHRAWIVRRARPSSHSELAFKFIDSKLICKQNIFIKTFISEKMAPHIGCNGRQEGNVIIIWINETLFCQREV